MFGRLTLDSIPYHEPIIIITLAIVALVGLAVVVAVTKAGKWQYLWNEWFTSVDHKKLGFMYIAVAMLMLVRGFADAVMMRSQQLLSSAGEA
ncbi:cytochrome o ubiquinol oxidase subunit I, partial [Vibrio parahaemolyticus]|nr:cytochrome o ubiquinol oxidase subunit I [Vibrio parahaemolyticus]